MPTKNKASKKTNKTQAASKIKREMHLSFIF